MRPDSRYRIRFMSGRFCGQTRKRGMSAGMKESLLE